MMLSTIKIAVFSFQLMLSISSLLRTAQVSMIFPKDDFLMIIKVSSEGSTRQQQCSICCMYFNNKGEYSCKNKTSASILNRLSFTFSSFLLSSRQLASQNFSRVLTQTAGSLSLISQSNFSSLLQTYLSKAWKKMKSQSLADQRFFSSNFKPDFELMLSQPLSHSSQNCFWSRNLPPLKPTFRWNEGEYLSSLNFVSTFPIPQLNLFPSAPLPQS